MNDININTKRPIGRVAEPVVRGSNNGTWGFGMYGAFYPVSMNGPLGYINRPLPNNNEFPMTLVSPAYNARDYNGPAYNQDSFRNIGGPIPALPVPFGSNCSEL
jgi:hypothetical protein